MRSRRSRPFADGKPAGSGGRAGRYIGEFGHGQHADRLVELVAIGAGIDDPQVPQGQVTHHRADAPRHPGRVLVLELNSPQRTVGLPHEVQLRAGVSAPEVWVSHARQSDRALTSCGGELADGDFFAVLQ